jgi:hypothetical protein
MGGNMAYQRHRSGSPGCEIELKQASKGSTTRNYFKTEIIHRFNAALNFTGKAPDR